MIVRLLPKSEIDKRKSEEQRTAIQEGIKIAERVDTLRETAASEEAAFEQYRTESLKGIQAEIDAKYQEKEELIAEVTKLRRERKELLIPLDFKWSEVTELEEQIKAKEAELSVLEAELAEKSVLLEVREREAKVTEGKAEDLKRLASAMFSQAETTSAQVKEEVATMRNKAQAELTLVELQKQDVEKRETATSLKEKSLEEKEKKIEKYEIELAKREQTLRAGWKNLENTINKLK